MLGTDGPAPPPPSATGAIRVGDWKLLVGVQRFATWFGQFSPNMTGPSNASNTQACANGPCLFNIKNDTTEHHDLAAAMPGKVSEMLKIFNSYDKKFHAGGSVEMTVLLIRLARAHACARACVRKSIARCLRFGVCTRCSMMMVLAKSTVLMCHGLYVC